MGVFCVFFLVFATGMAAPDTEAMNEENKYLADSIVACLQDPKFDEELLFDLKKENMIYVNRTMSLIIKYIVKRFKMRIKALTWVVENNHLKPRTLNNGVVVVDAQNFFYRSYRNSGLEFVFGCECDNYAAYLKTYLSMFKKANVNCYFVFKGGHQNMEKRLGKTEQLEGRDFILGEDYNDIVIPIFVKDVYKRVLDDMDFDYTTCMFEAKRECLALAQKLNCPIISYDIDFVFSGQPYIPYSTLVFNERNNELTCGVFSLDRFLQTYSLTDERLAVFAALTDTQSFPIDHFLPFTRTLKIPLGHYGRLIGMLHWLGKTTRDNAVEEVFQHSNPEDKHAFLEAEKYAYDMIRRAETPGVPTQYLENGNDIDFLEKDPNWFEKGVVSKRIPVPLINISQSHIVVGSWAITDNDAEDAMLLAMDIIKYSYNLLTNFQNQQLTFYTNEQKVVIPVNDSVRRPDYVAENSPFENGWNNLPSGLYEHFVLEAIDGFVPDELEILPEDCKLLMITLIYFWKRKQANVSNEILSLLLSYVALSVLSDSDKNNNEIGSTKMVWNYFDPDGINEQDRQTANGVLREYFAKTEKAKDIFNREWLHPLVEFQHCLEFLNHLNTLCGKPYKPTLFSKTFNGSFVYKVLYTMKTQSSEDGQGFVKNLLEPAPTVLKFISALYEFVINMEVDNYRSRRTDAISRKIYSALVMKLIDIAKDLPRNSSAASRIDTAHRYYMSVEARDMHDKMADAQVFHACARLYEIMFTAPRIISQLGRLDELTASILVRKLASIDIKPVHFAIALLIQYHLRNTINFVLKSEALEILTTKPQMVGSHVIDMLKALATRLLPVAELLDIHLAHFSAAFKDTCPNNWLGIVNNK